MNKIVINLSKKRHEYAKVARHGEVVPKIVQALVTHTLNVFFFFVFYLTRIAVATRNNKNGTTAAYQRKDGKAGGGYDRVSA